MPVTINGSDGITNASWTTGTRPSNPAAGQMGFNSETNALEFYDVGSDRWRSIIPFTLSATGGSVSDISIGGALYRVHEFTSTGTSTFEVVDGSGEVEYFLVAGGGAGSQATSGAGGAGGVVRGSIPVAPGSYNILVGNGGAKGSGGRTLGENGEDTRGFDETAVGGGRGAGNTGSSGSPALGGGSGGGGSQSQSGTDHFEPAGGSGIIGQGNDGGDADVDDGGGGGGGAGEPGANSSDGGKGGDGLDFSDLFGSSVGVNGYLAGGGAGYGGGFSVGAPGGLGGGGEFALPGQPNTGGGGGAHINNSGQADNGGGSGIVLIRYRIG